VRFLDPVSVLTPVLGPKSPGANGVAADCERECVCFHAALRPPAPSSMTSARFAALPSGVLCKSTFKCDCLEACGGRRSRALTGSSTVSTRSTTANGRGRPSLRLNVQTVSVSAADVRGRYGSCGPWRAHPGRSRSGPRVHSDGHRHVSDVGVGLARKGCASNWRGEATTTASTGSATSHNKMENSIAGCPSCRTTTHIIHVGCGAPDEGCECDRGCLSSRGSAWVSDAVAACIARGAAIAPTRDFTGAAPRCAASPSL
jgi:hypothetical protein